MFGEILGAAGIISSAFGKKKDKAAQSQQGFAALPQEVKDAYLKTYLPAAMEAFEMPYQPLPMSRVSAPKDIFDSQALYDLQQYSDAQGGLFGAPQAQQAPTQQAMPATEAETLRGMIAAMNMPQGRGSQGYDNLNDTDYAVLGRLSATPYNPGPGNPVYGNEGPMQKLPQVLNDDALIRDIFGGLDISKLSLPGVNRDYIAGRM